MLILRITFETLLGLCSKSSTSSSRRKIFSPTLWRRVAVKVCTTDDAARQRNAVVAFPFIIISVLDCTQYVCTYCTCTKYRPSLLYLSCTSIGVLNTCVGVYRLNIVFFSKYIRCYSLLFRFYSSNQIQILFSNFTIIQF